MVALEIQESVSEDTLGFQKELKNLKDDIENLIDDNPYTIEQKDGNVNIEYTDPKNPDTYLMFTIKNNSGTREISELHEGLFSTGDVQGIVLEKSSNDKNIDHLSKILKSYDLPPLKPEQVIEISLMLNN